MYLVKDDDGAFIKSNGQRADYRFGYAIQTDDDDDWLFVAAHRLTRDDCAPAHLCLVTPSHHTTS
jgi:hypothetical protein